VNQSPQSDKTPGREAASAGGPENGEVGIQTMTEAGEEKKTKTFGTSAVARNSGLVVALILLSIVGFITGGERFADMNNLMTILRLAATIGVVSIGMTFVITGGGIDLSVGAVMALSSVWATTVSTQVMADNTHWTLMVLVAIAVGAGAGLINGLMVSVGKIVPFIATLAMMASARGLAEIMANRQTQRIKYAPDFLDALRGNILGIPRLVWIFALVALLGWIVLNRTTFGRRTVAVGGNPEAARLAGINIHRHTTWLYTLAGATAGIAAVMVMARTTTGSSTHGEMYELDAIAAVVIGGTLLSGGRGTIVGTVFGVVIFSTLSNVFTLNNLSSSAQAVTKGLIIVIAVLLQQHLAERGAKKQVKT